MNDSIELSRANYSARALKIMRLCLSIERHPAGMPLTSSQRELAADTYKSMYDEIYFLSVCGLPEERLFMQELHKKITNL